ncbi:MAG: hypothetical protein NUW37_06030 [Planctomycetes bacterium]|nr:hypothetical protein [Planctomycetota bacterium]
MSTNATTAPGAAEKKASSRAAIVVLVLSIGFVFGGFIYKKYTAPREQKPWVPKVPKIERLSALDAESFDIVLRGRIPAGFKVVSAMANALPMVVNTMDQGAGFVAPPLDQTFEEEVQEGSRLKEKVQVRLVEWQDEVKASQFLTKTYFNEGRGNRGNIYQAGRFTFALHALSAESGIRPETIRAFRDAAAPELYTIEAVKLTPMMINVCARLEYDLDSNHQAVSWDEERYLDEETIEVMFDGKTRKPGFVLAQRGYIAVDRAKAEIYGFTVYYFDFGAEAVADAWLASRKESPFVRAFVFDEVGVEITLSGSNTGVLDFLDGIFEDEKEHRESTQNSRAAGSD